MTAESSRRYLTVRVLYPKPGRQDDILAAVKKVSDAARKFEGLVEIRGLAQRRRPHCEYLSLGIERAGIEGDFRDASDVCQYCQLGTKAGREFPGAEPRGLTSRTAGNQCR